MSEANEPRPALPPALFWRILVGGNLTSLAILLFLFHRMMPGALQPDLGMWVLAGGLLTAALSLLYRNNALRKMERLAAEGVSENARKMTQFTQVVTGCALAELPGILGTVYYLFTREWRGTVLLLVISVLLLLAVRPRD